MSLGACRGLAVFSALCMRGAVERVTIREAAKRLGVSQDTVRRRLKAGELQGVQDPIPGGFTWLVELAPDAGPAELPGLPEAGVAATEAEFLRRRLADLEQERDRLAELLEGERSAHAETRQLWAREQELLRVRALPPPSKQPEAAEATPQQVPEGQPSPAEAAPRPWWRFWLA
jgi:excisionase family DNA binding protein